MDFLTDFFLLQDDKKDKTIWRNSCFVQILSTILNHFRFDKALAKTIDIILLFLWQEVTIGGPGDEPSNHKVSRMFLKTRKLYKRCIFIKKEMFVINSEECLKCFKNHSCLSHFFIICSSGKEAHASFHDYYAGLQKPALTP
jgi:hypothetical protein